MDCGDANYGSNKCRSQSFLIAQKKAIKKWFAGTQTMDQFLRGGFVLYI